MDMIRISSLLWLAGYYTGITGNIQELLSVTNSVFSKICRQHAIFSARKIFFLCF